MEIGEPANSFLANKNTNDKWQETQIHTNENRRTHKTFPCDYKVFNYWKIYFNLTLLIISKKSIRNTAWHQYFYSLGGSLNFHKLTKAAQECYIFNRSKLNVDSTWRSKWPVWGLLDCNPGCVLSDTWLLCSNIG